MSVSTLDAAPRNYRRGAVSNAETIPHGDTFTGQLLARAGQLDYLRWLEHVSSAGGCSRPVRLTGAIYDVHKRGDSAEVTGWIDTRAFPDEAIYKACGNRRATICPSCARIYQQDAYQLLRAGLVGGKGIPDTVSKHPAVFATFTAPSFGPVHTRVVDKHTCSSRKRCDCRARPCHARRGNPTCEHGNPLACYARHEPGDARVGRPICLDCYQHEHQVVWNAFAGELWRRTKQAIDRHLAGLARQRGIPRIVVGYHPKTGKPKTVAPVRVSCGKAAEFQTRAVVHFHALLRLDGVDAADPDAIIPPPDVFTTYDLEEAVQAAVAQVSFTTPTHPDRPTGWLIEWGSQDQDTPHADVRHISLSGNGEVTDGMVAGYLAKYATKSTEVTGHRSTRITEQDLDLYADASGDHIDRLIEACWRLGRPTHTPTPLSDRPRHKDPFPKPGFVAPWSCSTCGTRTRLPVCLACVTADCYATQSPAATDGDESSADKDPYTRLRRWAHMLGFGGHFLTKSRRYSITFRILRDTRVIFRRAETTSAPTEPSHRDEYGEETILVINTLTFAGIGWHTSADAMLANTAAAMARQRRQTAREELAHEIGSSLTGSQI